MTIDAVSLGDVWLALLKALGAAPRRNPRGLPVREVVGVSLRFAARCNVLSSQVRHPAYKFMVAEWLWIWFGRSDVRTIVKYNPRMADFSDDGETMWGAYGPPVRDQWDAARGTLRHDPDSRQSVISIYRRPAGFATKDLPCTLGLQFMVRSGRLDTIAYMRSSDAWRGLPYDAFTFSMLGNVMAAEVGVEPGDMLFHVGSSHLYDSDAAEATEVVGRRDAAAHWSPRLPGRPPKELERALVTGAVESNERDTREEPGGLSWFDFEEPWGAYATALASRTNREAGAVLRELAART